MMLFLGIAGVVILWWLLSTFTRANPASLAKIIKVAGGLLSLGLAGLLGLRGRIDLALPLGGLGLWLLGWGTLKFPGFGRSAQPSQGRTSRVRSVLIEMELDHDTGGMDGSVLAGPHTGQRLNDLDPTKLQHLLAECHANDPDGARLLEAYLDRRFPDWRTSAQEEEAQAQPQNHAPSGALTAEEAYQILGLQPDAGPEAIRRAHKTLMKKLHPDQGGSTYLAARVNQAKDFLLRSRNPGSGGSPRP